VQFLVIDALVDYLRLRKENIKGNSSRELDECVLYFSFSIEVQDLGRLQVYASYGCSVQGKEFSRLLL